MWEVTVEVEDLQGNKTLEVQYSTTSPERGWVDLNNRLHHLISTRLLPSDTSPVSGSTPVEITHQ